MEPEGSLPNSKEPATLPFVEPDQSSPYPQSKFLETCFNIILLSTPRSSKCFLSLRFPHHSPAYISPLPICAICPVHLILLDFIIRIILGEQYRSLSSSLCSFLHSPVISSLLRTVWNKHYEVMMPIMTNV